MILGKLPPSLSTTFRAKRSPVAAAISRSASWKGLPSSRQSRTAGWSKKTGWCVQAIVSCPAQPIATALTPPEKPA